MSGTPIPYEDTVAARNEAAYKKALPTAADRLTERLQATSNRNYSRIQELAGSNGDCHSRKTTYRRKKFGKGNISEKGYLESGFEQG